MKSHWIDILKYNLWANRQTVNLLNQYDKDIIQGTIVNSFSSIEKTLTHIWGAEKIWLMRLKGKSLNIFPEFNGNLEEVFNNGLKVSEDFMEFIETQNGDFFTSICHFNDFKGTGFSIPVQHIIHHVMNHSTYHRGQIITLGRQAGFGEIKSQDYISYVTRDL